MKLLTLSVLFALAVFLGTGGASAQTGAGSIFGSVVDGSGQVVPGADIIITNENTGEVRRTTSNELGDYTFQAVRPGPYTVRAELTGFKPIEVRNAQVLANNRLSMSPLQLQVGNFEEAVSVSAVGEMIATTVTSHQAILGQKQMLELSTRGRDPTSLLRVLPGVGLLANDTDTFGGSWGTQVPNIQGGGGQTIYVDGINGGDGGGGGMLSGATNMDAIEEVNVQMSAYTAEYGLKGGAQVNFVTKHGGSEYHGTGYWYKRHEMWNATNFFNNRSGIPKPFYRYSTLGGTLGGPVPRVPKINSSGDKLFFFYSIDDTRLKDVQPLRQYTMPTALERAGDFSQTRTPSGALVVITDPTTGRPFQDNKIPAGRIDPRGQALLNVFPLPNTVGQPAYNYNYQEPSIDHPRQQHLIRVDVRPNNANTISGKYQTWYTKSVGYGVADAGLLAPWGPVRTRYDFTVKQAKFDYTRIVNTSTILEISSGFFRSWEDGPAENDSELAKIQRASYPGLTSLPQFAPQINPLAVLPKAFFGTLQSSGNLAGGGTPFIGYDNRFPLTGTDWAFNTQASVTHTRGSHTYKMGVMREDEYFGQARASIFGGQFNFDNDINHPGSTGYAYANAMLGQVQKYTESLGRPPDDRRQVTWAWYGQDTWKPTKKITLDIGLRMYKWTQPVQQSGEASGFSVERFDPAWGGNRPVLFQPVLVNGQRRARNPVTGAILSPTYIGLIVAGTGYACTEVTPAKPCQINGIVTQDDGHYLEEGDRGFHEPLPIQFDPRFGMAYAVNPQTVIRLAGGSFHDGTGGYTGGSFRGGPAYRYDKEILYTDFDSYLASNIATALVPSVTGIERTDAKRPNNIRFTAAVQRDLGAKIVLDAAYVGTRSKSVAENWNYNWVPNGARFLPENRDPTVPASAANPGALADAFLRPIIGYNDIAITKPTGRSTYDSLQVQLTRRFTGDFEMAGSYTWARGYQRSLRQTLPSTMDRTDVQEHVMVVSYMYAVPSASKRFGDNGVVAAILDNWRLSGISTFATGGRGNVGVTYSPAFDFTGGGEGCTGSNGSTSGNVYNVVGNASLPSDERNIDRWFNTDAFTPATGRGDQGNMTACNPWKFRLPGYNNHDLSLFKDIRFGNQTIQYRWEIYNLFNSVQFQTVNTSATFNPTTLAQTNSNFGKVTAARNERRMQMALRYSF
jgi:Carboxypeptidase regulatory-like domain